MLRTLSRRFRVALLHFLTMWTKPTPLPRRLPRELVEGLRDIGEAKARNDCRAIGKARQRLRQARLAGLSAEVANLLANQIKNQDMSR